MKYIFYAYPMWKKVSFSLIAEKHVQQLRKYFNVETIDENTLPFIRGLFTPFVIVQPFFYPFQKYEKYLAKHLKRWKGLIGVDVADSNRISSYAVRLTEYASALIVPSSFSKNAFLNSGVKVPVHILPHGVDEQYINTPKIQPNSFKILENLKQSKNMKILVTYILHSDYRKGLDLLEKIYSKLRRERKDIALAIKDLRGVRLKIDKEIRIFTGWLSEQDKMELFDLSDLFLLTSRGGGFEHPCLEAIARGVPAIGAEGGAWQDYMCKWMLIPSKPSGTVLAGNSIHTGVGVEMIVDKAVDKIHHILDNLEEYRVKTREHVNTVVKKRFIWSQIGLQLRDIILRYM